METNTMRTTSSFLVSTVYFGINNGSEIETGFDSVFYNIQGASLMIHFLFTFMGLRMLCTEIFLLKIHGPFLHISKLDVSTAFFFGYVFVFFYLKKFLAAFFFFFNIGFYLRERK